MQQTVNLTSHPMARPWAVLGQFYRNEKRLNTKQLRRQRQQQQQQHRTNMKSVQEVKRETAPGHRLEV